MAVPFALAITARESDVAGLTGLALLLALIAIAGTRPSHSTDIFQDKPDQPL
jgi:hypothetical protein